MTETATEPAADQRVVVITGAASGIGFATAELFRDAGDLVFGLDISGTVPDGVDPSLPESAWALNGLGWFLVLLPFIALAVGYVVALVNKKENEQLVRDFAS